MCYHQINYSKWTILFAMITLLPMLAYAQAAFIPEYSQGPEPITSRFTLAGRFSMNDNDYADEYMSREALPSIGIGFGYNKRNLLYEMNIDFRPESDEFRSPRVIGNYSYKYTELYYSISGGVNYIFWKNWLETEYYDLMKSMFVYGGVRITAATNVIEWETKYNNMTVSQGQKPVSSIGANASLGFQAGFLFIESSYGLLPIKTPAPEGSYNGEGFAIRLGVRIVLDSF